jgi:hypothetical protein
MPPKRRGARSHDSASACQSRRGTAPRLSLARVALAPAFGAALALCYLAGWLALERALTARVGTAMIYIGVAAMLSAAAALLASRLLAGRPWSARFAAALLALVVGTTGLASLFMTVELAWTTHPLPDLPLHVVFLIIAFIGIGALYGFLAIAGHLILPLGLPIVALFALLIARPPR